VTRRQVAAALVALASLAAPAAAAPVSAAPAPASAPDITASSAIVVDADDQPLYERRADRRRAIASTTKLMTALLALERADLDDELTAVRYQGLPAESTLGLEPGERMRVHDLLTALMLASANDAAATIAAGIAGSQQRFVELMNERAAELGLDDTSFANPIGLDDADNYSTARDLATLATAVMRNRRFAEIVARPRATLSSGSQPRTVENRNRLVGHELVDGIKTGYTLDALNVLVGSGEKSGLRLISVVLGEPTEAARDADTLALLRHGFAAFDRHQAVGAGDELARAAPRLSGAGPVALVAARGLSLPIRRGDEAAVDVRVSAPPVLEGPLPAGSRVGEATVSYRGARVGSVPLETAAAVPAPALADRARLTLEGALGWIVLGLAVIVVAAVLVRSRTSRPGGSRRTR
jgi:D-alanyl-D-alanine carboxypeptidase (penicillin-binding protein 5/6)